MKIFCVIPAYNEERSIVDVVDKVKGTVDEIIVVDDCSTDKTFELALNTGVIVLRHVLNRGQGAALETGNLYALKHGADIVVHFDADGQFLFNEIVDVLQPLKNDEADMVFGSRFLGKKTEMPFFKENILFPIARKVNNFFGVKTTDPQSGFRAMNRKALKMISIQNDGSAHCTEILTKAFRYGLRVKEVPITVVYNEFGQGLLGGKGRGKGGLAIVRDLILSRFIV